MQSTQRATEWRNGLGSAALSAVNDFMDKAGLKSTEERQETAADLLFMNKFAYSVTEDTVDADGNRTVSV